MLENIVFSHPIWGIITFVLGGIGMYFLLGSKKNTTDFLFFQDIEAIFGNQTKYLYLQAIAGLSIVILFSLIFAQPKFKFSKETIKKNGIDIVLVLDLSYSMVAEDIKPNRLEMAKKVINDFVGQLKSDRIGLVVFSGKPFTSIPLTFDYDFVSSYIKNLSIQTINQDYNHLQGTAIGDGLLYGANLFPDEEKERQKVIVLLTDGEANKGIDPLKAIQYVNQKGIQVDAVGIGGDEDTYVMFKTSYGMQKIPIGGIDEDNLKAIANLTGGTYFRAKDDETFQEIFKKLNLLDKNQIEVEQIVTFKPLTPFFIWVLLGCFGVFIVIQFLFSPKK